MKSTLTSLYLCCIFFFGIATAAEGNENCKRYGSDFDWSPAETEKRLIQKSEEAARIAENFSRKREQLLERGVCSKYEIPNISKEDFSTLLEEAVNNPSEENICSYYQYEQFALENACQ